MSEPSFDAWLAAADRALIGDIARERLAEHSAFATAAEQFGYRAATTIALDGEVDFYRDKASLKITSSVQALDGTAPSAEQVNRVLRKIADDTAAAATAILPRKLTSYMQVSNELLNPTPPDPAEVERVRLARATEDARDAARHAELLASPDPVTRAMAELHSPHGDESMLVCEGCDVGGFEAECPLWPCRSWTVLDETAPKEPQP